MKDKITSIIKQHVCLICVGYKIWGIAGEEDAAEAITQEVCNAQANGWWDGNEYYRDEISLLDYLIQEGYTVEQAKTAIDQLKNKQ